MLIERKVKTKKIILTFVVLNFYLSCRFSVHLYFFLLELLCFPPAVPQIIFLATFLLLLSFWCVHLPTLTHTASLLQPVSLSFLCPFLFSEGPMASSLSSSLSFFTLVLPLLLHSRPPSPPSLSSSLSSFTLVLPVLLHLLLIAVDIGVGGCVCGSE